MASALFPSSRAMAKCTRNRRCRLTVRQCRDRGRRWCQCPGGPVRQLCPRGQPGPRPQRMVPTGTWRHRRAVRRHDGDGGEVSEMSPEGAVCVIGSLHLELHHGEVDPVQLNVVGLPSQARLDEGGRRQIGHVEHAAGSRDSAQGSGHRRVGQLDDQRHLRPQLPHAQSRLEGVDLVNLDTDDGHSLFEMRFGETLAPVGVAPDVLDPPVLERPGRNADRHRRRSPRHGCRSSGIAPPCAAPHPGGRTRSRAQRPGPLPSRHVANRNAGKGCRSVKCRRPKKGLGGSGPAGTRVAALANRPDERVDTDPRGSDPSHSSC